MSEQPDLPAGVPQWDLADRMRKALREAQVSPGQMAEYLDVGGNTVSTWINGRVEPSTQTIRLWALRTAVSYEWIRYGIAPQPSPEGGDSSVVTCRARHLAALAA